MGVIRPRGSLALRWVLSCTLVGLGACASGSGGGSGGGSSADVISRSQIEQSAARNAFDVIVQYRSRWLRPARNQNTLNGRAVAADRDGFSTDQDVLPNQEIYPRVYLDESYFGDLDALRQFSAQDLESIEFIDAREATTRYGTGNTAGIIMLRTPALGAR